MWALRGIQTAVKERLPVSVIGHFFVYAAGKIAISGISVIMAPIMMVILSPAEYGLLSLIHSFNNSAIACIGLGLPQVLMVEYFRTAVPDRAKVVNSVMFTYIICSVPVFILCVLFPRFIQAYLFLPACSTLVYAILLICLLSFLNDIMFQILQYHRYAVAVTTIQLCVAILMALLNIICVGYYHYGVASVVWAQCCTVFAVIAIALFLYYKNGFHKAFDGAYLVSHVGHNLKLGIPLLPSMMAAWFFALLNRWMVAKYAGLEIAGIFAVADAGGQLFYRLVLHPLQGSYGPALLHSYAMPEKSIRDTERSNHHIMGLALIAMLCASIVGYFLLKYMFYFIIPAAYVKAIDCVLGVFISYIFLIGAYFVSNLIQFQKQRWIFIIALSVAASINIFFNITLIPRHGLSGCVFAMALGYGTYFCILLVYNRLMIKNM